MTDESTEAQDKTPMGKGCSVALILLLVAIAGMARSLYLPGPDDDAPLRVIPGATWKLTIPTDLPTVNGMCRIESPSATIRLDGDQEAIELPVEGVNQDTWGNATEVTIVTVGGVPVISGRDEVTMVYRFDLSAGADWVGRDGKLTLSAKLVYPFTDIDDVVVGSLLGTLSYEERTYDFETRLDLTFVGDKKDEAAGRKREKLLNFVFAVLGVLAVITGLVFAGRSKATSGSA